MKEEALKLADWLDKSIDADDWGELAKYYQWCHENVSPMIRRLVEELDYLKDQISFYEIKNLDSGIIGKIGDSPIHDLVHRTTPQTKPLSDEEMWKLWYEIQSPFDFGRAIEERHGIK
jgi:hypothetical protein